MLLSFFHTRTWMRGLHVYSCGLIDLLSRSIQNNIYTSQQTARTTGGHSSLWPVLGREGLNVPIDLAGLNSAHLPHREVHYV